MKNFRIEFKWALIFSAFTLFWMAMEKTVGLHDEYIAQHAIYTNLIAIPYLIIFYLAIKQKRDQYYNGIMTWQQGMISGSVISTIIAVLSPLITYISVYFISPDYFQNAIEYSVKFKDMKPETAESFFSINFYLLQAVFGSLAMGIVTSAVMAWILRRKPKNE